MQSLHSQTHISSTVRAGTSGRERPGKYPARYRRIHGSVSWQDWTQPPLPFLLFVAGVFAAGMTIGTRAAGGLGSVAASVVVLGSGFIWYTVRAHKLGSIALLLRFIAVALPACVLNVFISEAPIQSALKWGAWITSIIVIFDTARATSIPAFGRVLSLAPALFAVGAVSLALFGVVTDSIYGPMHMAATYFSYILAFGIFSLRFPVRVLWVCVGLGGIYLSGTRGAILSVPLALMVYSGYLFVSRRWRDATIVVVLLAAIGAFALNEDFRDSFLNRKKRIYSSGLDSAIAGVEQRAYLAEEGFKLARERPFGRGAGNTYGIMSLGGKKLGAHNGYIDTLIQLGFPTSIVLAMGFGWICWRFLMNPALSPRTKAVFLSVLAILAARAGSESYSIFDVASFHIFFVWYIALFGAFVARGPARKLVPGSRSGPRSRPGRFGGVRRRQTQPSSRVLAAVMSRGAVVESECAT